jgi:hypothetical protein
MFVDSADGGAPDARGYFFERRTPLFRLGEMLHKPEDFLLAFGEVGCFHFTMLEKKSKFVNFFSSFFVKRANCKTSENIASQRSSY